MPKVIIKRIKRTWREFWADPVFARCWWVTNNAGERTFTRAESYLYPGWPEAFLVPAEIHEGGHLKGLEGQSWPIDVMWEAPGKLADTIWEKVGLIFVGPVILGRRIFTGDWFSAENRAKLDEYDKNKGGNNAG